MLDSLCRKTQERRAYLKGRTALPPPEKLKQIHEDAELQERLRVSHNALNDALSAYACPVMTYDVASGAWRSNMISRKSRGPQIKVPLEGERVAVVDAPSVVDALVRLAASRQLYKLRLCDQCKRVWRVSERRMDRFCSGICRQMAYAQDPEFNRRRRDIQRRYRQNQKERAAREGQRFRPVLAAHPCTSSAQAVIITAIQY
jgi:hypothetical protein